MVRREVISSANSWEGHPQLIQEPGGRGGLATEVQHHYSIQTHTLVLLDFVL